MYFKNSSIDFPSGLIANVKNVQLTINANGLKMVQAYTVNTNHILFRVLAPKKEVSGTMYVHAYVIGTWK